MSARAFHIAVGIDRQRRLLLIEGQVGSQVVRRRGLMKPCEVGVVDGLVAWLPMNFFF